MAIPEFILRKLIVPGSLQSTAKGFQFILLNTFAPATITSFGLKVGELIVQPESIFISSDAFDPITALEISSEKPMLTPVGVAIKLSVEGASLNGAVQIQAMTKEVGEFEFTLAGSQPKQSHKKFKPAWTAVFRPTLKASVTIDQEHIIGQASPYLLGQFVEHLERCVYDGIWTKDGSELRQNTLKLIRELNPPMIRYPGGNFASGYHWEDGIGPREKRPSRHDAAWQAEESNQVGTDEFLSFCGLIGSEPYLVVNDGSGTPEEAARWVAYCNSPEDSEQGRRRAANGHPQPYNVKYWGVGNEVWGPWQIGTTSANEYARRLKRFIKAMKAVDSSIKIIAVGNNPLSDDLRSPASQWNEVVLQATADEIDFLSWHIYQPEQSGWRESYDPQKLFAAICSAPLDFEAIIHRVEGQIQKSGSENKVLQSIDEWNVWLPPGEKAGSMHQVTYTMRDSLYVAGIINVLFRHCNTVGIANLAQLVNVLPLIQTDSQKAIATAIYYPFVLASKLGTTVLKSLTDSPVFSSEELGENVSAHPDVPYLDALITRSDDAKTLSLLLINRHPENRLIATINSNLFKSCSPINSQVLRANSPLAYNTFDRPTNVCIHPRSNPQLVSDDLKIELGPASISFFQFKI